MRDRTRLCCLLGLVVLLTPFAVGAQPAPSYRAGAGVIEVIQGEALVARVPLEGPIYDLVVAGRTLYAARGPLGVAVFDVAEPLAPRLLHVFATPRSAVKLSLAGTTLVVVVADYSAVAYDVSNRERPVAARLEGVIAPSTTAIAAAPAPAPAPSPARVQEPEPDDEPAPATLRRRVGRGEPQRAQLTTMASVTAVRKGWVSVESDRPVHIGDRFEILSQALVSVPDPATGETRKVPSNRRRGLLVIEQTSGTNVGSGPLLKGTIVERGDLAVAAPPELKENLFFPPLWRGMTRIQANIRALIPVQELGFGAITTVAVDHYFKVPMVLGVQLAPLAFLAHGGGASAVAELRARIGYAHDYFEITIDPGALMQRLGENRFSLAYSLRVGALDGAHFTFQNSYEVQTETSYLGDKKQKFQFGNASGEFQIPVHRRATLALSGGGSAAWAYGTLGVRGYLRGAGGPGTVILSVALGGGYFRDRESGYSSTGAQQEVSGYGPLVSFGIDARL